MSITRALLRIAAVKALHGNTIAGEAVFDSMIDPVDARLEGEPRPLIVVYTDDQQSDPEGRSDYFQGGTCDMVIEVVVGSRAVVAVPEELGGGNAFQIEIPNTDGGFEFSLDLIEAQVARALVGDLSPWARVWRSLSTSTPRYASRRGASVKNATRFAARQMTISTEPLIDLDRGMPIDPASPWGEMLALMEADQDLRGYAAIVRAHFETEPLTEWRRTAERLGVNLETVSALGLGPVNAIDPEPFVEGEVEE